LAEVYRQKVGALEKALNAPGDGTLACEAIRSLVEHVVLHPVPPCEAFPIPTALVTALK